MTTADDVRDAARRAYQAGLCVVPPKEDGTKAPETETVTRASLLTLLGPDHEPQIAGILREKPARSTWKHWQHIRPSTELERSWYANGRTGLGSLMGRVSGNMETFEFDDPQTYQEFKEAGEAVGLGELIQRIETGYLEQSAGGGYHWIYRCEQITGSTELAKRPNGVDNYGRPIVDVLIETRGEGGYIVLAPSHGRVHPSGRPYRLLRGAFDTIATITPDERRALWELGQSFDEMPKQDREPSGQTLGTVTNRHDRPGDDYNARGTSWREILEPHGWVHVHDRGVTEYWRRPGKDCGISATINGEGVTLDRLYVFSSSTPFESRESYSKFASYAVLEHGGDYQAAAKALRAEGYGASGSFGDATSDSAEPELEPPAVPFPSNVLPEPVQSLVVDGAAALGCPPEFVGLPLLSIAAGIIGNTQRLQLKAGWERRAILSTAVIGDPGTGKTPGLDIARAPMERLQREAKQAHDQAMECYKAELAGWERADRESRGQKPDPPRMRHFYVADATLEAIQGIHEHEPGLVLVRDELVGWVKSHDAYRKAGDRQSWLSAWSGTPIKIDRKTGVPVYIHEPAISVTGGVQPDMLSDLAEEAGRHDGFIDRFLWSFPEATPLAWSERTLNSNITTEVEKLFRRLRSNPRAAIPVQLSNDAKKRFVRWHDDNARLEQHVSGLAKGIYAKLPDQLARLCLVLHCLRYPDDPPHVPISDEMMGDAIELVEYFRAHAHRVLPRFGSAVERRVAGLTDRVLRVLRQASGAWVNQSDIAIALGGHVPAADLEAALESLASDGRAEQRTGDTGPKGGRPPIQWRVKTQERESPENDWGEL